MSLLLLFQGNLAGGGPIPPVSGWVIAPVLSAVWADQLENSASWSIIARPPQDWQEGSENG